jgi:mono/diheme cytochrome c family protein
MSIRWRWYLTYGGALLMAGSVAAQSGGRPGYNDAFIGPPLADPVMQYNKESYVMYGCAYCHGVNLVPRGETVDLRRSALVGSDVDGRLIVGALRAGFWQTTRLSPMPQYSDVSDQQLHAIAAYIHYARQRDRYIGLTQTPVAAGSAAAGEADFAQRCQSCHVGASLAGIGKRNDAAALRGRLLEPPGLTGGASFALERLRDTRRSEARRRHERLLENHSTEQVANLVAYLQALK